MECYNVVKNNSMLTIFKWYDIKPNKCDNLTQDSNIEDYIDIKKYEC